METQQLSETLTLAERFMRILQVFVKLDRHQQPVPMIGRLALNQLHALVMLHQEPGLAQKELAERLGITPAAVSMAVRELGGMGLIERREDSDDARLVRLYLSSHGQDVVQKAHARRCQAMAHLLSALPIDEQRMVVEALERAVKAKTEEAFNIDQP